MINAKNIIVKGLCLGLAFVFFLSNVSYGYTADRNCLRPPVGTKEVMKDIGNVQNRGNFAGGLSDTKSGPAIASGETLEQAVQRDVIALRLRAAKAGGFRTRGNELNEAAYNASSSLVAITKQLEKTKDLDGIIRLKNILIQSLFIYIDEASKVRGVTPRIDGYTEFARGTLFELASLVATQDKLAKKLKTTIPATQAPDIPFKEEGKPRLVSEALNDPSDRIRYFIGLSSISSINSQEELQQLHDYLVENLKALIEGGFVDMNILLKAESHVDALIEIKQLQSRPQKRPPRRAALASGETFEFALQLAFVDPLKECVPLLTDLIKIDRRSYLSAWQEKYNLFTNKFSSAQTTLYTMVEGLERRRNPSGIKEIVGVLNQLELEFTKEGEVKQGEDSQALNEMAKRIGEFKQYIKIVQDRMDKEHSGTVIASGETTKIKNIRDENVKHETLMAKSGIENPRDFLDVINGLIESKDAISITVLAMNDGELPHLSDVIGQDNYDKLKTAGVEFVVLNAEEQSIYLDSKAIFADNIRLVNGIEVFTANDKKVIEAIRGAV